MPTYIDESGDPSRHPSSPPYFRLAGVWLPTLDDQEEFERRVRGLRKRLGLPETFEFKHAKTHHAPGQREAFLLEALELDFRFAVSVVDKREPYWARTTPGERLWACVTDLAAMLRPVYLAAEGVAAAAIKELVVLDRNDDKEFLQLVKQQFRALKSRARPGEPLVGKVNFRDSSALALLQLADMLCGIKGALLEEGSSAHYDLIRGRDVSQ